MKNSGLIIVLIILTIKLTAQDIEPSPLTIDWQGTKYTGEDNKYIIGWQWGSDARTIDLLNTNMVENHWYNTFDDHVKKINPPPGKYPYDRGNKPKIKAVVGFGDDFQGKLGFFQALLQSFTYKPSIPISNENILNEDSEDDTHQIWGFKNKHSSLNLLTNKIIEVDQRTNKKRVRLELKASGNYYSHVPYPTFNDAINEAILYNSYVNNQFFRFMDKDDKYGDFLGNEKQVNNKMVGEFDQHNGKEWYVGINLKKIASNLQFQNVLKIKIRCKLSDGSERYINFSAPGINEINFTNDRGRYVFLSPNASHLDEFVIKNDANLNSYNITDPNNPGNTLTISDVTLLCKFVCDGGVNPERIKPYENPRIQPANLGEAALNKGRKDFGEEIVSMSLEVYYYEGADIQIDNIRILTPKTFEFLTGKFDNVIKLITEEKIAKKLLDYTDYELYRIYGFGGDDGLILYTWDVLRYFNLLFGGIVTSSIPPQYSNHYYWHVAGKDRWIATPAAKCYSTPYYFPALMHNTTDCPTNYSFDESQGIKGFTEYLPPNHIKSLKFRTACSDYETFILGFPELYKYDKTKPYPDNYYNRYREFGNYLNGYAGGTIGHSKFLETMRKDFSFEDYSSISNQISGNLLKWEASDYGSLYTTFVKNGQFLYNDSQPWWGQVFISHIWHAYRQMNKTAILAIQNSELRACTGEFIDRMLWSNILKGAKGLCYDIAYSYPFFDSKMTEFSNPVSGKDIYGDNDKIFGATSGDIYNLSSSPSIFNNDYSLLINNGIGGDYIQGSNDNTKIYPYLYGSDLQNYKKIHEYLGVPQNKIYIGHKSVRTTLRKVHDWITENNDILMNLRLRAWFGKGYKIIGNQSPDASHPYLGILPEDPNFELRKYVKLPYPSENTADASPVKVRPIDRTQWIVDNGYFMNGYYTNYYLPPDSTFYDITLLQEKDQQPNQWKSMDQVFYIGAQSRNTDPNILKENYASLLSTDVGVDFYSSAEFDEGVTTSSTFLNHDRSWWLNMWWKRLGCREISIPLNVNSTDPTKYKLVRVTELTRSDKSYTDQFEAYNSSLSPLEIANLKEALYPKVETIIGQDGFITAKFLPGEGKLFKCEVLDVDDQLSGNLAHSNQCKLVAFPIWENGALSQTKIQYHLTYFKEISIQHNGITLNKRRVIYNRSVPMEKNSDVSNIQWETTKILNSDVPIGTSQKGYILSWKFTDGLTQENFDQKDCDYPSIVIRNVGQKIFAYIGYTCKGGQTNPTEAVYLGVLDVTDDNIAPLKKYNWKIEDISFGNENSEQWGNPVLSACPGGNFMAWSTARSTTSPNPNEPKIITIFLEQSQTIFPNMKNRMQINMPEFRLCSTFISMKHPSVITYSNITNFNSNGQAFYECPIVWQGSYYGDPETLLVNKIVYTKLKYNSSTCTLENILPSSYNSLNLYVALSYPTPQNNILIFDEKNYQGNVFPVIFKNDYGSGIKREIISAGATDLDKITIYELFSGMSSNTLFFQQKIDIEYDKGFGSFSQANLSQPSGLLKNGILDYPYGNYILNFKTQDQIFQYLGGTYSSNYFVNRNSLFRKVATGADQAHLSASSVNNSSDPWKNRRVFNDNNANILASAKYFYLLPENDPVGENLIGWSLDSSSFSINLPKLNTEDVLFIKPISAFYLSNDSSFTVVSKDTLFSDWFRISNENLELKISSVDSLATLFLQYDDNYMINLPFPQVDTLKLSHLMRYNFSMGEGRYYRLILIRRDTLAYYQERIVINGLPIIDTLNIPINLYRQIANDIPETKLRNRTINLELKPNPANDELFITLSLPNGNENKVKDDLKPFLIKIYSVKGDDLIKLDVDEGTTKIPIKDLPQGLYYIRAEEITSKTLEKLYPAIKSFVIER